MPPSKHNLFLVIVIVAFMVGRPVLFAQETQTPTERAPVAYNAGEAEVALQGYYLGGSGQNLTDTSGMAINFREFIGGVGLISPANGPSVASPPTAGDTLMSLLRAGARNSTRPSTDGRR